MNEKNRVQKDVENFWDKRPCDSDVSSKSQAERLYYEEIEADRYLHQGHINTIMDWVDWEGKKVLEIGTGVGTDARNMIQRGAIYQGINVDKGSVDLTSKALAVYGHEGRVDQCSATELMFPDESFDVVYSFGVLHHIPDADAAIKEVYRVLKPGGELLIMVYNRTSINYKLEIMFLRKLFIRVLCLPGVIPFLGLLRFPVNKLKRHAELYSENKNISNEEWLSRNTDGPDNPYSIVYDYDELDKYLSEFNVIKQEVFFFDASHWGVLGRLLPKKVVSYFGSKYGWHRVAYATKP